MVQSVFKKYKQGGFTLLEVLLVVAILAILAGIVIVAINPGKQLGESRNSQRSSDVNTILNAVYQYSLDNNGTFPPGASTAATISATATEICATGATSCAGLIDLSALTNAERYLTAIPKDPQCSTACATNGTGYRISRSTNGRITVTAPATESKPAPISVTR